MSGREERAQSLVEMLLAHAHVGRSNAALLRVADPEVVRIAAEILALTVAGMVAGRVEWRDRRDDDLFAQIASQTAIILTLTDPGAES